MHPAFVKDESDFQLWRNEEVDKYSLQKTNYKTRRKCQKQLFSRLWKFAKGKQQNEHRLFVRNFGASGKNSKRLGHFLLAMKSISFTARRG